MCWRAWPRWRWAGPHRLSRAPSAIRPGNIKLWNDSGETLEAIYLISEHDQFLTDTTRYALIPGAVRDMGDLPLGFTYLNFPSTPEPINIGNVLPPGTPLSDLSGAYFRFGISAPAQPLILCIPEPATAGLASVGLVALAAVRLRRSRAASSSGFVPPLPGRRSRERSRLSGRLLPAQPRLAKTPTGAPGVRRNASCAELEVITAPDIHLRSATKCFC